MGEASGRTWIRDLWDHNPIARSHHPSLFELEGQRPAVPPNRGRPLVTAQALLDHCGTEPARTKLLGDFLRARDNPGHRTTWRNARKRLLTWAVG
jgi:hypothetical protein